MTIKEAIELSRLELGLKEQYGNYVIVRMNGRPAHTLRFVYTQLVIRGDE